MPKIQPLSPPHLLAHSPASPSGDTTPPPPCCSAKHQSLSWVCRSLPHPVLHQVPSSSICVATSIPVLATVLSSCAGLLTGAHHCSGPLRSSPAQQPETLGALQRLPMVGGTNLKIALDLAPTDLISFHSALGPSSLPPLGLWSCSSSCLRAQPPLDREGTLYLVWHYRDSCLWICCRIPPT